MKHDGMDAPPGWPAGAHRLLWWMAVGTVTVTGVVAGLFKPGLVPHAGMFIGGAALALALVLPFAEDPWKRPRSWLELAFGGGVAAVALQGLASWLEWWTLVVLVLLVGTSPWVLDGLGARRLRAQPGHPHDTSSVAAPTFTRVAPRPAPQTPDLSLFEVLLEEVQPEPDSARPDDTDGDPGLRLLDIEQLCGRWQRSFARLQQASSPALVLAVAWEREELLSELTRRDPDGVASWLADGPRVTGDPRRYLRRTQEG